MAVPFTFDVPDLAGGLNESAAANIADREMARLSNFYVQGASVYSRRGMEGITDAVYTGKLFDIARYNPGFTSEEFIIFGANNGLAKLGDDSIDSLSVADGRIYPTLDTRWWHAQYNDEMFWCRRGNGGVKRVYGDSVCEAGIAAPTAKPIVVDGGPGKKEAGTYRVAYRYFNKETGARSNWSPWSKAVQIADLRRLAMSEIGISTNPQVNARQIGATNPTNGVMYLVGQINDNTTTTFIENASAGNNEYGEADVDANGQPQSDYRHGMPPDQAIALCVHKERLFVLNAQGLYWSEPGWMQSFKASSFYPIQKGTGLLSWEGHGLIITTTENAKILIGDTPSDWRVDEFSKEHGCPDGHSMAVGDGVLFYYTGVNIVRSGGGGPEILPRIERIQTTLAAIPEAQRSDVFGLTIPSRGWYVAGVPQPNDTVVAIVYDYKADCFSTLETDELQITGLAAIGQPNRAEAVVVCQYEPDLVWGTYAEFLSGGLDWETAIPFVLETKNFGWDRGITDKVTRRVGLLTNRVSGTLTIKVYHDDALVYTRTGLSLNSNGWKRFTVDTAGTPGALVRVRLEYSGTDQLRIDQMQIDGVNLQRRVVPV